VRGQRCRPQLTVGISEFNFKARIIKDDSQTLACLLTQKAMRRASDLAGMNEARIDFGVETSVGATRVCLKRGGEVVETEYEPGYLRSPGPHHHYF
jgi:hypothetical protein